MRRFFVEAPTEHMSLCGDNHTHIAYSLRLKAGDTITLFCGDGYDYLYKINDIKKKETLIELNERIRNNSEPRVDICAFLSLINKEKMNFSFQKLTELGVKEFFPMITEYSQWKKQDFNAQRYQKICIEACKQCERSVIPSINSPIMFFDAVTMLDDFSVVLFAYEKAELSIGDYLRDLKVKQGTDKIKRVAILVGAEGGFAESEVEQLRQKGIMPIKLGERILRAETAAIATASAVLYELDW